MLDFLQDNLTYIIVGAVIVLLLIILFSVHNSHKKTAKKVSGVEVETKDINNKQEVLEPNDNEVELEDSSLSDTVTDKADLEAVEEEPEEYVLEVNEEPEEEIVLDEKQVLIEKELVEETKVNLRYAGKFEIFQEGDFYKYRLKASNGEVLVVSQMYKSKDSAYRSIESLKRNVETGSLRIIRDKTDRFIFKLVAKNHRVMAISSHYASEPRAIKASESFHRFTLSAEPVEIELDKEALDFNSSLIDIDRDDVKDGGKYIILKDEILNWCWELKASNGQILCSGEGYTTKAGAQNAITNFKSNVELGNFYVVKNKSGRFQFKLFSPQGRLVILGESYPVKANVESAANSVVSFYKNAVLEK